MNRKIFLTTSLLFFLLEFSFAQNVDQETNADQKTYEEFDDDEFAAFDEQFSDEENIQIYDPLEPLNRKIFIFNETLDLYAIDPMAKAYRDHIPKPVRKSVHNFVINLTLPFSVLNSFAQGKLDNGLAALSHFVINSTIGVFGLFDVAGTKEIRYNREDFGQTLGHYGLGSGPYLVLPILGASNFRDLSGRLVENGVDPLSFNFLEFGGSRDGFIHDDVRIAVNAAGIFDGRVQLIDVIDDARKDSFDLYAKMRSYYTQNRDSLVNE